MNKQLRDNNFIIVRNFIPEKRAKQLAKDLLKFSKENTLIEDTQVLGSPAIYNHIPFVELLCEKTKEVAEIVGEGVIPSYVYSRIYSKGHELTPHVDRESSEIAISLNLDGTDLWPLWVQTPDKENFPVELYPGDALVYLGREALHWRDSFEGTYCNNVFMFYVLADGPNNSNYFDRSRLASHIDPEKKKLLKKKKPGVAVPTFKDYIQTYDDVLSAEECEKIVQEFLGDEWPDPEVSPHFHYAGISSVPISGKGIQRNPAVRSEIDQMLFQKISNLLDQYRTQFPELMVDSDTGYNLFRIEKGGFVNTKEIRPDVPGTIHLQLTLFLNDDFKGGEVSFYERNIRVKPKRGSALLFPSNFLFPSEIMPVIEGTRYTVMTWVQ